MRTGTLTSPNEIAPVQVARGVPSRFFAAPSGPRRLLRAMPEILPGCGRTETPSV
jgi:hypothetical protein